MQVQHVIAMAACAVYEPSNADSQSTYSMVLNIPKHHGVNYDNAAKMTCHM